MGWDTDRDFAGARPPSRNSPIPAELAPGEQVAWEGQPRLGSQVVRALPLLLFGLPFTALPLVILKSVNSFDQGQVGFLISVFNLPFLLIGLALLGSPAWAAWKATRTYYAVTDRRVILCEPQILGGLQIRSYTPESLGNIVRNQRGDGSGDLIFEEIQTRSHKGRTLTIQRGFFGVNDVRAVEHLIRTTLIPQRATS